MGKILEGLSTIKSIRETVGRGFARPDPSKLEAFITDLWNTSHAKDYLRIERALSDETIEHFKLGYDASRNAIAIPIFKNGELVNIKYRLLEPKDAKYTSERGAETWMYNEDGIQHAKKMGAVLVVEGEFDLMSVWQSGIKHVVSPASGKDSYGVWLELLDSVPRVFLAYDNDVPGKDAAYKFAERIGVDKSFEITYPTGIKDANEYFKKYDRADFRELVKKATPFYKHQFKGVGDVINSLRNNKEETIKLDLIPNVRLEKDWLVVISGKSNVGKTGAVLNMADELTTKGIPTLIMPFERGINAVGKRFLQVKFDKTIDDLEFASDQDWEKMIDQSIDLPLYFAMPKRDMIVDTIKKAKRLFNTRVVIIDHLDYVIRHTNGNKENEIANTLQDLKRVAEEHGIILLIVTHIRKIDSAGAETQRKPNIEDLKGSSSLYQDPECVVLLTQAGENQVEVIIAKNKGPQGSQIFDMNHDTGKIRKTDDF